MNNEKIAKYIQNIFHLENMTADDDSYNKGTLHSNSWGDGITIRWVIRDFGDEKEVILRYAYSLGSYTISIGSGMTSKEASKEIVELIGRVLITQADTVDPNTGMNNILSWPYNCNLAYLQYLIEALQYSDNEIKSSKKPIKSAYKGLDEEVGDLHIDMTNTGYFEDGWLLLEGENELGYRDGTEFTINAYGPNGEDLGSKKFDFLDLWHNGKPVNSSIQSSMQGQERGIQAIMDEYGCSREEALEIMNDGITSGCHGKAKKKNKKEIKSTWSIEDETDYWTADDEERLRGEFADERGLNLNEDEFPEDEYKEWVHQGAAMYSSTRRNITNINRIFG